MSDKEGKSDQRSVKLDLKNICSKLTIFTACRYALDIDTAKLQQLEETELLDNEDLLDIASDKE